MCYSRAGRQLNKGSLGFSLGYITLHWKITPNFGSKGWKTSLFCVKRGRKKGRNNNIVGFPVGDFVC